MKDASCLHFPLALRRFLFVMFEILNYKNQCTAAKKAGEKEGERVEWEVTAAVVTTAAAELI